MRIQTVLLAAMICTAPAHALDSSTSPVAASGRAGGVYRLASDASGLWVWHLRDDGMPATGYATALRVDTLHDAGWSAIEADGFGGAFISYRALTPSGVRTMRVAPALAPAPGWALHGDVAAASSVGPGYHGMATDFAGGLFTAWQDFRVDYNDQDIVMQHMTSLAMPALGWPANGLFVCDAPGDQYDPVLTPDLAGGVFAVWYDARALGTGNDTGFDIWAQSISPEGSVRWATDGVPVTRRAGHQVDTRVVSDGQGGLLVVWVDLGAPQGSPGHARLGVQRLNSSGGIATGWPADGVLVGDGALSTVRTTRPPLVPDGQGGAYVLWVDGLPDDSHSGPSTLRIQHLIGTGAIAPGWPLAGKSLATSPQIMTPHGLVSDGQGGVIACWLDPHDNIDHLMVQRVRFSGTIPPGWPTSGITVAQTGEEPIWDPVMVEDQSGGATLSWYAALSNPEISVRPRVRRLTHDGVVDPYWSGYPYADGQPVVSPTPSQGPVSISFALPTPSAIEGWVFDLSGRRVRAMERITESAAGRRTMAWDGRDDAGDAVPVGLYFVRLRWAERDHTARVVIAR